MSRHSFCLEQPPLLLSPPFLGSQWLALTPDGIFSEKSYWTPRLSQVHGAMPSLYHLPFPSLPAHRWWLSMSVYDNISWLSSSADWKFHEEDNLEYPPLSVIIWNIIPFFFIPSLLILTVFPRSEPCIILPWFLHIPPVCSVGRLHTGSRENRPWGKVYLVRLSWGL